MLKKSVPHDAKKKPEHKKVTRHYHFSQLFLLTFFRGVLKDRVARYSFLGLLFILVASIIFFITYKIIYFGGLQYTRGHTPVAMYETPAWLPKGAFVPFGIKVVGARQLLSGCNHSTDECWKKSIESGLVKFIGTPAKITIPGYESRNIMFAFFKNTSKEYGASGLYNCLPIYADDGSLVGPDIIGGITSEIDWVYGTIEGIIIHDKNSGNCYEKFFNKKGGVWSTRTTVCPS